jgi:hypothetical protein
MKQFVKEILRDTTVLSTLTILPLAYFSWQYQRSPPTRHGFQQQHRSESIPGETTAENEDDERYIPILRAFDVERQAERRPRRDDEG